MPEQTQIVHSAVAAAPNDYTLADNVEFKLVAVNANFADNGAGSDWLPAVVLLSDSGHVIARALLPDVKVTAGDDAEVSFFPGVKPGGAATPVAFLNQSVLIQSRNGNQTIPSGVVTPITFTGFVSSPGYTPGLFGNPTVVQNPITYGRFGTASFMLVVTWSAGAYDRYVEMTIANPDNVSLSPRVRSQLTPDGDRLTLPATIEGGPLAPNTTVTANVFQASGVDQTIRAQWVAKSIDGVVGFV